MYLKLNGWRKKYYIEVRSYGLLLICAVLATVIGYFLYQQTATILQNRLKERLTAIVSTASLQFDPKELDKIQDEKAIGTDLYKKVIYQLNSIRLVNQNLKYAYILRPTDDPNNFKFIADADSIDPNAKIDLNNDGIIDENDALVTPGEDYDVSEIPAIRDDSIKFATTDPEPTSDQWGNFLSGYAPIKENGKTVAVLGIDVEISDYLKIISRTFIPFALFISFLLLLLTILTYHLVTIWRSQVDILNELDRQKDELISMVSHQLNSPITALKWTIESLLEERHFTKSQLEMMHTMQGVSSNLSDLVTMLLDVSRLQLGRMTISKLDLDLKLFFKELLSVIYIKAKEKDVILIEKMPKNLPIVKLDKRLTRMVIENLLTNAVKYTDAKKHIYLNVSIENNKLLIEIKDEGCGIPKNEQGQIFGKLFRASNVRNNIDGNGFGLYVAKGAVESQGGKIWFQSIEGKGTTFFVELPI